MKPRPRNPRTPELTLLTLVILTGPRLAEGAPTNPWSLWAPIEVDAPALYQLALPVEVLGAARSDLADLRVLDSDGMEVPYIVHRPEPQAARRIAARAFRLELEPRSTVLTIETGAKMPIDALVLETAERSFIKAASLEGSEDGRRFVALARGVPLFRGDGAENLRIEFTRGPWAHLRVRLDDERSPPVGWLGASLDESAEPDAYAEPIEAQIRSRDEAAGKTRFAVDLGAANLSLSRLELVTNDPLFQRRVGLREAKLDEEGIHETEVHADFIYAVEDTRRTSFTVARSFPKRELIVVIENGDSPPLQVTSFRVTRRPVFLRFQTREAGPHRLFLSNPGAGAPKYDLDGVAAKLKEASARAAKLGPLQANPDYGPAEPLPELAELGAELDLAPWRYRKPVTLEGAGVHALELDPDVLSHAAHDLSDLRLVFEGRQIPYVIERPSISRRAKVEISPERDEKRRSLSRWRIGLSHPRLPLTALECRPVSTLFRREVQLFEQLPDGRGGKYTQTLGSAVWERKRDTRDQTVILFLTQRPRSDALVLETDNGDNPPLELADCELSYPAQRAVFKTRSPPTLYYGNPKAHRPRYDLSLVAEELLAADRAQATGGPEEEVGEKPPFSGDDATTLEGWMFWAILAGVMVGLLLVIAKLLPKPPERS